MFQTLEELKKELGNKILSIKEHSPKRFYVEVKPEDVPEFIRFLFDKQGARFSTASGIDVRDGIEILYHMTFDREGKIITVRTLVPKPFPEIESLANFLPAANWIEREIYDLLGVKFRGHPDFRRLLLSDDWPEGVYPLRRKEP